MDLVVPSSGSAIGCTGSLISGRVILTAAHCALAGTSLDAPLNLDPVSYAILPNNLDDARKATFLATVPTPPGFAAGTLKPAKVLIHPSYDEKRSAAYDVMLLVLPDPIPRSVMKPLRVSGGYGYGSGPSFWEGYVPRFFGVGPSDDACQGQAGIPVRFLDNAMMKEATTFFRFRNGGADGHTCFGDSGGPYLTRAAQNWNHPGHTLSDNILISILSQTLDGGAGDDVGPILEEGWMRGWLEANALDRDGDWMESWVDKCDEHPGSSLEAQDDKDNDGVGDACDPCPADPDNGDADGDRILNCLDPCPDNELNPDSDADGLADCVDPCPSEGKLLNAKDTWGDADFDGVCNAVDNCPLAANLTQNNANRRSEEAQKADILGDWCDPVPVPDFTPLTEVVDDPAGLVPCVDPECPGFTPADQAFLKCGSIFHNALSMRPLRSQHRTKVDVYQEVKDVGTVARFCQIDKSLGVNCIKPDIDIQDERLSDAECAAGCATPETEETRFHRVSFLTGGNADPDGPPVPLDYTLKPSDPDPGIVWTWDYTSDYERWMSATPPLINPPVVTGDAADMHGNFWTHAITQVGADPNVADPGFFHGKELANHHRVSLTNVYKDVSGFYPEKQGCYACVHLLHEDLPWDTKGGSPGSPSPVPPPFLLWRPSEDAADAYRRFSAAPGEASLLVRTGKGLFAAVRAEPGDCNGELVHEHLGTKLRERLSDPTLLFISAAEPSAAHSADLAFPVAVALSSTTADLIDTIQEEGGSLLADADRAATRLPGVNVPNVTRFAAVLSRLRRGVYVIGGEDIETGTPSGRIWFRSIEGRVWKLLPDGGYRPEKVLAVTYSVATDSLFVLDEQSDGTARLAAVDPHSGAAKTLGSWPRHPSWDLHWLVADHDGAVLLASASRSLEKHALARIAMSSGDLALMASRLEGEHALVLPPLVDASGTMRVLRSSQKNQGILTMRLRTLPLAPASLVDVGQAL